MSNVQFAYDYFNLLGYRNYSYTGPQYNSETDALENGTDSYIYLAVLDSNNPKKKKKILNEPPDIQEQPVLTDAAAKFNLISVCDGDGVNRRFSMADTDVAVHEFTHLITQQKLNWSQLQSHETKNISEAYGDIFAELSDPTPYWKVGTDIFIANDINPGSYCIRDLSAPQSTEQPETSSFGKNLY